jgi:Rne/Rng family ribonuclease
LNWQLDTENRPIAAFRAQTNHMNKEMIIASNGHETRVAILEDDLVAEIFVERERNRGVVGNVYKGRVSKVLPGMQSAFVDIGLERDGFLYVSDVISPADLFDEDDEDDDSGGNKRGGSRGNGKPDQRGKPNDRAVANEARPGPSKQSGGREVAARPDGGRGQGRPERDSRDRSQEARIEDLLREGQEILVQVAKEPLGTKGARLTSHVTLPGRFLVFMPTVDHIGVSRKIASREERARLRGIVREFREQHDFSGGVIIRTAAEERSKDDILADLQYFYRIWVDMRQKMESHRAPAAVYREPSLVAKLLRDLLTDDYTAIRIDHPQEYQRVVEFIDRIMPTLSSRVKLHDKDYPIFEEYGVQAELDKALRSKVWLKSGGSIVINQTEALVAIDVNTGRYVGKKTAGRLEDTILKTNLEAVKEIVRQIRLRDLGGIIVLDFIDMEEKKNRQKVFQAVEQELRKDRSPSKPLQVSDFGLVIVTRKRVKQSLERVLTEPCPYCSGAGTIKSSSTICYEILAEVKKVGSDMDGPGVLLRVNPDIARALKEEERNVLKDLKHMLGKDVIVKPDVHLHHEQFDLMSIGG